MFCFLNKGGIKQINQQVVSCHDYLFIKVIVTIVEIVMSKPPLVLHVDVMIKLVGLGLLQLHKHNAVMINVTWTSIETCSFGVTASPAPHSGRASTCGSRPERSPQHRSLFTHKQLKYNSYGLYRHDHQQEKYVLLKLRGRTS